MLSTSLSTPSPTRKMRKVLNEMEKDHRVLDPGVSEGRQTGREGEREGGREGWREGERERRVRTSINS